jgi:hypothetical protein
MSTAMQMGRYGGRDPTCRCRLALPGTGPGTCLPRPAAAGRRIPQSTSQSASAGSPFEVVRKVASVTSSRLVLVRTCWNAAANSWTVTWRQAAGLDGRQRPGEMTARISGGCGR